MGAVLMAVGGLLAMCQHVSAQARPLQVAQALDPFAPATAAAISAAREQGIDLQLKRLPASAWDVLEASPSIAGGTATDRQADIVVIFDVNCPYCAALYRTLHGDHGLGIAVRWVPVGFMKQDSAPFAQALLAANDPARSLHDYFMAYDGHHRGSVQLPSYAMQQSKRQDDGALLRHLGEWGGYAPMIIIRTADGEVLRVQHDKGEPLRRALGLAQSTMAKPRGEASVGRN